MNISKWTKAELAQEVKSALYMAKWYRVNGNVSYHVEMLAWAQHCMKELKGRIWKEKLARSVNAFPKSIRFGV